MRLKPIPDQLHFEFMALNLLAVNSQVLRCINPASVIDLAAQPRPAGKMRKVGSGEHRPSLEMGLVAGS